MAIARFEQIHVPEVFTRTYTSGDAPWNAHPREAIEQFSERIRMARQCNLQATSALLISSSVLLLRQSSKSPAPFLSLIQSQLVSAPSSVKLQPPPQALPPPSISTNRDLKPKLFLHHSPSIPSGLHEIRNHRNLLSLAIATLSPLLSSAVNHRSLLSPPWFLSPNRDFSSSSPTDVCFTGIRKSSNRRLLCVSSGLCSATPPEAPPSALSSRKSQSRRKPWTRLLDPTRSMTRFSDPATRPTASRPSFSSKFGPFARVNQ